MAATGVQPPRSDNGYEHFEFAPFSESADVIEDFGMLTESPQFRTTDRNWPVWAGFSPFGVADSSGTPNQPTELDSTDPQIAVSAEHLDETSDSIAEQQFVTLDQMAALVNRSKKTLERWLRDDKLPAPDVKGGGGGHHTNGIGTASVNHLRSIPGGSYLNVTYHCVRPDGHADRH